MDTIKIYSTYVNKLSLYTHIDVHIHMCIYTHLCTCTHVYTYTHTHKHMHKYVSMYIVIEYLAKSFLEVIVSFVRYYHRQVGLKCVILFIAIAWVVGLEVLVYKDGIVLNL